MPVNRKGFPAGSAYCDDDKQHSVTQHVTFLPGLQRGVYCNPDSRSWRMRSGNVCSRSVNSFRGQDIVQGIAGQGMIIGRQGRCAIVLWDANSNGQWDSTASENDSTGFRLESGSLETLRGATSCDGKGWDKLTDPDRVLIEQFMVTKTDHDGFAPVISIELRARRKGELTAPFSARHTVTGFNL